MAGTSDTISALAAVQKTVDSAAKANEKAAQKQLAERNAAVAAAESAGLSVDAGALEPLGAFDAARRYLTLQALLADCQAQLEQIASLTE